MGPVLGGPGIHPRPVGPNNTRFKSLSNVSAFTAGMPSSPDLLMPAGLTNNFPATRISRLNVEHLQTRYVHPELPQKISVDNRFTETDLKHFKLSVFQAFSGYIFL